MIADHLRSTSFLIADGVMPSSDGRGYVLRRIMRRAMRHAHLLGGAKDPVMYRLVPALIREMGAAYPELGQAQALIEETLRLEETRFKTTLDRGLKLLDDELSGLPEDAALPGEVAFKLYDTYGFPLDLTQDALREKGREVATEGFDTAMAEQKAKARASWAGSGEAADATVWFDIAEKSGVTEFLGYDTEAAEGANPRFGRGWRRGRESRWQSHHRGEPNSVLCGIRWSGGRPRRDRDRNRIRAHCGYQKVAGVFLHIAEITSGEITKGQAARLTVAHARRSAIRANHSATHLLHEALRRALGDHVAQKGSLNAEDRLRFDFSHSKGLSAQEIAGVEAEVNEFIRQNTPVDTRIMTPDDARALGAQALFGEKYGDEVRVVSMGRLAGSNKGADKATYSLELCGGTHVKRTGDIGAFVALGDSASSAGVRRFEALTGQAALDYLNAQNARLVEAAAVLKLPLPMWPSGCARWQRSVNRSPMRLPNCAANWRWAAVLRARRM